MIIPLAGRLVLVGAGKMGGAMLEGWLKQDIDRAKIAVIDPSPPAEVKALITESAILFNPPISSIANAEIIVVAVKPQTASDAMAGIGTLRSSRPLVISVVAGKTIAFFEKYFGSEAAIIRTIPNTPAAVGRGITAMAANKNVSSAQQALARALLSAIGEVVTVADERQIDAVTALSGSGPAYVFLLTECLAEAGKKLGLPEELATRLARATVSGSGELMRVSGLPAATLRQNVTSPKGTTHAALQVLMAENGMMKLFEDALTAAEKRSRELAS
jgi:pyrroline-5-carboxylate reductase